MIQQGSVLFVSDNTGVKKVNCIKVLGGSKRRYARIGDLIKISVISTNSKINKKGDIYNSVLVNTKYNIVRPDGTRIRFFKNSVVLLDDKYNLIGTRILDPIPRELTLIKNGKYIFINKIASLSPEII
ncbi:50S ribosomal protein L14 [Candidatus Vidania fulgoroideae]|uniref:Large ribosomal subunit protein uL14 n=1 Tax=Candidatus Vidania fulgoroideorum TaxID=881286 RepID=A0AAX3NB63_9PROT|nr:50S ribosomal protein L14 [Candidatus Vidania fulgoroideae]WDR79455.1 50S ribosomal protein L14 [Candidatus Vidania fulgoroideae]